jgi:hypothetical protein
MMREKLRGSSTGNQLRRIRRTYRRDEEREIERGTAVERSS